MLQMYLKNNFTTTPGHYYTDDYTKSQIDNTITNNTNMNIDPISLVIAILLIITAISGIYVCFK